MKKELEEKLFNDFPLLFERNADMRNSSLGFGFECGDGWYQLIRDLCEELYPLIQNMKVPDPYMMRSQAVQVKEKYGTLRFYMNYSTDKMEDIIHEYEDRSSRVCETCGKPGEVQCHNKWYTTTCQEHKQK